jgi:hypothetical protein
MKVLERLDLKPPSSVLNGRFVVLRLFLHALIQFQPSILYIPLPIIRPSPTISPRLSLLPTVATTHSLPSRALV